MSTGDRPTIGATMYASAVGSTRSLFKSPGEDDDKEEVFRQFIGQQHMKSPKKGTPAVTTRLVKVFIVDPTESLAVNDRLLHKGEEMLTDLTDDELYFELDIKGIVTTHNEKRVKTVDKRRSTPEKEVMLEPVRVRDLRMQVIVLAAF